MRTSSFLSLPLNEAVQVIGSLDKLQAVLKGMSVDKVLNAGKDPLYHYEAAGGVWRCGKTYDSRYEKGNKDI